MCSSDLIGAVYVSGTAHDGWDRVMQKGKALAPPHSHEDLPVIGPLQDPKKSGGHAFALVGYNERGFIIQNSWGTRWGASGFATLAYEDWISNGTDCWAVALGVPQDLSDLRAAQQLAGLLPLAAALQRGDLGEIHAGQAQRGAVQPAAARRHRLVDQAVVDRRRFPAHAPEHPQGAHPHHLKLL